jgi:hypothetical protein
MLPADLQATLKAGIDAVRQGDRARGRAMLLQVVAANDRVEPAWLWLSAAVDDPADQLIALENVLALNPGHPQARAGAQALRQKLGLPDPNAAPVPPPQTAPPPAPNIEPKIRLAPEPATGPPPSLPFPAVDPEDDPYQCAYCGRPTEPEHTRCPHCRRGLLVPESAKRGGPLYVILIAAGLQTQSALVQAVAAYGFANFPVFAAQMPGGELFGANLVVPALLRAVAWVLVVLLLLGEVRHSLRLAGIVAAADLAWSGVGLSLGFVSPGLAGANAAFSGFVLLVSAWAVLSDLGARVRLKVVLDRNVQSGLEWDRRAARYAGEGKWALAALHWRRAIALRPRDPELYRALGQANRRLGRLESAQRAWASGAALAPDDPDFARFAAPHQP